GKKLEVPISHNGIEKLAQPEELEENDCGSEDMFEGIEYESEEVKKEEGYYTGDLSEGKERVDWEEISSPAIYLTALEEVPTWEEEGVEYTDEKHKMELDNLTKEEQAEVMKLFGKEGELFAEEMNELTQTN
ncbi:10873_t:CDS:1, partial [Acaulospora morrowiae]